jgi:hypothetical protein
MTQKKYFKQLFLLAKLTIILLICGDLTRKTAMFFDLNFIRYTAVVKIVLLLLYAVFFMFHLNSFLKNKIQKQILYVIIGLCGVFFLSNIFPFNYSNFNPYNTEFLAKYLFFPTTFLIFYQVLINRDMTSKLFKLYEYFFLFNLIIVFLSFLFDIEFFKSYHHPDRFGYSGLIYRPNQISYISILFILIYYYKNQILKNKNRIILFVTIGVSLLIGTKRIYLFLLLLFFFHLFRIRKNLNIKSLFIFIISASGLYFFREKITELFISKFALFIRIYEQNGLWASVLSYRNDTLAETYNDQISPNWNFFNYIFGGVDFTIIRPEMDVIDIFFYFGLCGFIAYFIFIKNVLKPLNTNNLFIRFSLITMLLIAFVSSGFFNSSNIPFIFFIALFYLNELTLKSKNTSLSI